MKKLRMSTDKRKTYEVPSSGILKTFHLNNFLHGQVRHHQVKAQAFQIWLRLKLSHGSSYDYDYAVAQLTVCFVNEPNQAFKKAPRLWSELCPGFV